MARLALLSCAFLLAVPASAIALDDTLHEEGESRDRRATLLYNTASRLFRQKNWSEASASFGEFLDRYASHPDACEARFARGYCFNRLGKHAAAVEDFRQVRDREKESWAADANFYLARSLEALAGEPGADEATRRRRLVEAADAFGVAARIRSGRRTEKGLSAVQKSELLEQEVQAIAARGEMLYRSDAPGPAAEALTPLLESASRFQNAPSYPRGLYYLALSRYGLAGRAGVSAGSSNLRSAIAVLEILVRPQYESGALWSEAAFLLARIYRTEDERDRAIALYDRLERRGGGRSIEAAFQRSMARYESRRPAELKKAAAELARLYREHDGHPLAPRARFFEALSLFDSGDFAAAAERLDDFLARKLDEKLDATLRARSRLCLGQALLVSRSAKLALAEDALTAAADAYRGRDVDRELLGQAVYWRGEARLARGGEKLAGAAADFRQVAEKFGDLLPSLAEDSRHNLALALSRAGDFAACARAAREYRALHGKGKGRHYVDSLKLSARNALEAPEGALDPAERRRAAEYYLEAAALVPDAEEAIQLRYFAGVASYRNEDLPSVVRIFTELHSDLDPAARAGETYGELGFFLADAIARQIDVEALDEEASRVRLARAIGLFEEYLKIASARPGSALARHRSAALYNLALCHEWAGELDAARRGYREFLDRFPAHELAPRIRYSLAEASLELGDLETASREYLAAARQTRDDAVAVQALLQAAAIDRRQNVSPEALKNVNTAIERVEGHPGELDASLRSELYFERASLLVETGATEEGRAAFEAFLGTQPQGALAARARVQLAYLHLDANRSDEALGVLRPVVSADVSLAGRDEALYVRAWALDQKSRSAVEKITEAGEAEKARANFDRQIQSAYRQLIREYPQSSFTGDAMVELAQHHFNRENYPEAEQWFRASQRLVESLPPGLPAEEARRRDIRERSLFGLGFIAFEKEDYAAAAPLFDRVAARRESELAPRALFQAARAWMRAGKEREAVDRFRRLVEDAGHRGEPFREEALLRLGECYHRLQDYDAARVVLKRQLDEFPEGELRHDARFNLGFALQYLDRSREAVELYQEVVGGTSAPVAARAQYHIGECFMDLGDPRRAAREFLTVVANFDIDTESYRPWFRRALLAAGIAYQDAGDGKSAGEMFAELLQRFPETDEGKAARARLKEVGK